jgi:hypothetical protein
MNELSALVTDAELRSMVVTLMSAGQGTVQHQLGNAMAAFLANPEQWRLLGDRPDLAARTAEEVVRYCPSALLGVPRIAKSDVTITADWLPPTEAVYGPTRLSITSAGCGDRQELLVTGQPRAPVDHGVPESGRPRCQVDHPRANPVAVVAAGLIGSRPSTPHRLAARVNTEFRWCSLPAKVP